MKEVEVDCYEIDGKNYIIGRKAEYNGSKYLLLVNENDYTDSFVQKEVGEELEPVDNIEILNNVLQLMTKNN